MKSVEDTLLGAPVDPAVRSGNPSSGKSST